MGYRSHIKVYDQQIFSSELHVTNLVFDQFYKSEKRLDFEIERNQKQIEWTGRVVFRKLFILDFAWTWNFKCFFDNIY